MAMPEHITTVNIPDMDEQHKELFSAVVALKDSSSCIQERPFGLSPQAWHFY